MRLPVRLPEHHPTRKVLAALAIAVAATVLSLGLRGFQGHLGEPFDQLDNLFYDAFYRLRPAADQRNSAVIVIAVDEQSEEDIEREHKYPWIWPREMWVPVMQLAEKHGARAIAFDLLMNKPSVWNKDSPDDKNFAEAVDGLGIPVILPVVVENEGARPAYAPPFKRDLKFGAVDDVDEDKVRRYHPQVDGVPSLAVEAMAAAGIAPADRSQATGPPFMLHYYGRHRPGDRTTFRYLRAGNVVQAGIEDDPAKYGINPSWFRDKIVLIGVISTGAHDIKVSPLESHYPGVEVHATAIQNLLEGRRVHRAGPLLQGAVTFVAAVLAALGGSLPRTAWGKVVIGALTAVVLLATGSLLFQGRQIRWVPTAAPLLAMTVGVVGAVAWSYFTEDRSRRFILKAFSQYVSPTVAERVARNPKLLALGGDRRDMTVMFSDIAGFTDMSERIEAEKLSPLLNHYLGEMSTVVLAHNGTLDKYIGDAVMAFWNAPLDQLDHAERACRAALAMLRRESEIQPALRDMGADGPFYTRIGIHTGPMVVGNMGSTQRFNYTVIGDSVNLAARMEGSNKAYRTQLMVSETTAVLVRDKFIMRPLDVIQVKGKLKPMPVFEVLAEVTGTPADEHPRALAGRFGAALKAYQAQRWDEAEGLLSGILVDYPDDPPSLTFLGRIAKYRVEPPGADWDGVHRFKDK